MSSNASRGHLLAVAARVNSPQNTSLEERLRSDIARSGPLSVADYMAACLGDQEDGYYPTRDPFGGAGDFVTAPEISGLFGEMCGLYLAHMYELYGQPDDASVIELGPGRGSLMRDLVHVWTQLIPPLAAAPIHLLETSPYLRRMQADLLQDSRIEWHDTADSLTREIDGPVFGIANEFFDALPIQQMQFLNGTWCQRLVGLVGDRLGFATGEPILASDRALPEEPGEGQVAELCPQADQVMAALAALVARKGGAILVIDYGRDGNPGDSLQAVANHTPVDIFHEPGAADLSHWVDFAALRRTASDHGARLIGPVPQGRCLMRIGLAARAEAVASTAAPEDRRAHLAAIDRLTSPAQMGEVFKVALLVPAGEGVPPGFEADSTTATDGDE